MDINNFFDNAIANFLFRTQTGIMTIAVSLILFFIWLYINTKILSKLDEITDVLTGIRRNTREAIDPEGATQEVKDEQELEVAVSKANNNPMIWVLSAVLTVAVISAVVIVIMAAN